MNTATIKKEKELKNNRWYYKIIALYFNTTPQTLNRWKKGSAEDKRRYRAFKNDFIANNKGVSND